jgi:ABC-type transport system involved in multi-copper enzyme maturation permease subunit
MRRNLFQMWRVACYEWFDAIRSKRAWVVLVLYLAAAMCNMNWSITLLGKMEAQLASVLQLPPQEQAGVVSTALWKSKPYQGIVRALVKDDLVYQDISGRHPVELIYAWFAFFYAPLLVVLVAGNRVADDLGSGSVRYMLFRVSRACWSFGKFVGQGLMIGLALACSAVGAYAVAKYRLSGSGAPDMFFALVRWSFRAWIYSFAYLGLALGLSHLTRSGSKATVFGILAIAAFFVVSLICRLFETSEGWRSYLSVLMDFIPQGHEPALWRSDAAPFVSGCAWLVTLGVCYLTAGYAVFRKRDA